MHLGAQAEERTCLTVATILAISMMLEVSGG